MCVEVPNTLQRGMNFKQGCEKQTEGMTGRQRTAERQGKHRHRRQHRDRQLQRDIQPPRPIIHADRVNVTRGMIGTLCLWETLTF